MEMWSIGFFGGVLVTLISVLIGAYANGRDSKGDERKHKPDNDSVDDIHILDRSRHRSSDIRYDKRMGRHTDEEMIQVLHVMLLGSCRYEREVLNDIIDFIKTKGEDSDMGSINNLMYNQMYEEFKKDGKFADYVRNCMRTYGTSLREELHKAITWEYYKSVVDGCNKEKQSS